MIRSVLGFGYNLLKGTGIGKIPGVYPTFIKLYKLTCGEYVTYYDDIKLTLTENDNRPLWYSHCEYEPGVTKLFAKLIRPGMIVADVGAAIGYYTLIAAKLVGYDGIVFAFEPIHKVYDILRQNIKLNEFTNIIPYNLAISDYNGSLNISYSGHTFLGYNKPKVTSVPTVRLDSVLDDCDLVKIDVEGFEIYVLRGMTKILEKGNVKVICELSPRQFYKYTSQDITDLLKSYGYDIFVIDENTGELTLVNDVHSDNIMKHYLFMKGGD